jgi:malonyl-CoA/methylmalonyl-CoA synthetase
MNNPLHDAVFGPWVAQTGPILLLAEGPLSGRGFTELSQSVAFALAGAGVRPGDRVAAQVAKSPAALALYAAALRLGAVFLPLNTAYTPAEVDFFLRDAAPRVFVHDPAFAGALPDGVAGLTLDAAGRGSAIGAGRFGDVAARGGDDLAALLYTSGTTGRSKGAMLTHDNLLSNARVLVDVWGITTQDVLLHALPIFHTHGLFVACNTCLIAGAPMIWQAGFDAAAALAALPQATLMMGVPTFYTRLLAQAGLAEATRGMRLFISGSAPLLAETHRAWEAATGHRILERYGMTETNMNTSNPLQGDRRAGTVGLPLPGVEVRLGPGEVIEVRGPNVFKGYWNLPDKTAEDLRPDGWFITGDVGRIDGDGYVTIVGRAKDIIITGGLNVYPVEVEAALDAVPGVRESAVIGLPHPDFGEAVFAVIAADDPGVAPRALAALEGLARFKQPKAAVVVPDLPRNAMGKVQKAALRATYSGWFTSSGGSSA